MKEISYSDLRNIHIFLNLGKKYLYRNCCPNIIGNLAQATGELSSCSKLYF